MILILARALPLEFFVSSQYCWYVQKEKKIQSYTHIYSTFSRYLKRVFRTEIDVFKNRKNYKGREEE